MRVPQRLGKYPISRVIGEGAMGVVYEAFDPVIRRPLAIKTIRRELVEGSEKGASMVARFRNEAQAAGRLMHPGIAAVHEYGEDDDCAYIVMEFVSGASLREYLARNTRFPEHDVLSIMCQLLDALEYADHPERGRGRRALVLADEADAIERAASALKDHPDYAAPESLRSRLREIIDSGRYRMFDA